MSTRYGKADFFALLAPIAIKVRSEGSPLFPSTRLAQNWLETGGSINDWNNLGGYKVGSGVPNAYWKGEVVNKGTWEVYDGKRTDIVAAFRAYDSIYDFYKDQDLLFQAKRYAGVRAAQTPEEQAKALLAAGYATDPTYAAQLISIMTTNNLKKYDIPEEEQPMTADEKAAFDALQTQVKTLSDSVTALTNSRDVLKQSILDQGNTIKTQATALQALSVKKSAPAWFVSEFGSGDLGGLIKDPTGSDDFWRGLAVVLRLAKAGRI